MELLVVSNLYDFDREAFQQHGLIIGTDEVGRGPLAGPVVSAAVILDLDSEIEGLNDSKKLTEKRREILFPKIIDQAVAYGISFVFPHTIDSINILQASLLSMSQAITKVTTPWEHILVDGNKLIPQRSTEEQSFVIKGDSKSASIAAASIVAKVVRDRYMVKMASRYPQYGLEKHKGYPTKQHREALGEFGMTPIHRISFSEKFVSQTSFL